MKNLKIIAASFAGAFALVASTFLFAAGCAKDTATSVTQSTNAAGAVTTTTSVVVSTSLNPAAVAQIDAAIATIISNAPAAFADAQKISTLIHGTNK